MPTQEEVDALCRKVYTETKDFYGTLADRCENLGFQILYGPPFIKAPILFIGYQPGSGFKSPEEERAYGSEDRWPPRCEYATERWPLARNMRRMFGRELLERCVGLNAIFIRSPSVAHFRKHVDRNVRREIESFCLDRVSKIVEEVHPKTIVAFGFEALDLFVKGTPTLTSESTGRVLTKTGTVAGHQAIGTLHLSGARISNQDRATIANVGAAYNMKTPVGITVRYWIAQTSIEGLDEFRAELASDYAVSLVRPRPGGAGGGSYQLLVEFVSHLTLASALKVLLEGAACDLVKSEIIPRSSLVVARVSRYYRDRSTSDRLR